MSAITPSVSVVVPTFNQAPYLAQALDSILAQTIRPVEILVWDDGSTDDTQSVLARYKDSVRAFSGSRQGVYAVRQSLLEIVKGDWFLNLDSDDWIEPDFLERTLAVLAADPDPDEVAFIYPDSHHFDAYDRYVRATEYDARLFKRSNFVIMDTLIRTSAARKVGFDAAFNEGWGDYDFFFSLSEAGYRGVAQHDSPLHYRVHGTSITSRLARDPGRGHRLMEKIIAKHRASFSDREARAALAYHSRAGAMRNLAGLSFRAKHYATSARWLLRSCLETIRGR